MNYPKYVLPAILISGFIILIFACSPYLDDAIGYDDVITVLASDENWEACEPILNETLGQIIRTPQNEPLYLFNRIDAEDLNMHIRDKNLLILSRMETDDEITSQLKAMLPETTLTRLRKNHNAYYKGYNAYAKDQSLLIVVAKSTPDLRNRLSRNRDDIFDYYEENMFRRRHAFIYRSGELFDMAEAYYQQYGWYVRIMHDYVEIENNADKHLVWLGRDFPYRWLTVAWATPNDTLTLQQQSDKLLRRLYGHLIQTIKLNNSSLKREDVWFKNYAAIKYTGLWEYTKEVKGGPFIAFSFYEPVKDRIYLLSGMVHAPNQRKVPYLRQLETILNTFSTEIYKP